jgi:RimJ/RimL family protein N-acetyltransferase
VLNVQGADREGLGFRLRVKSCLRTPPSPPARLLLRPWRERDLPAVAAMNANPRVMEWAAEAADPRGERRVGEAHQRPLRPPRVRPVGGEGARRGGFHWFRRPGGAVVPGPLHACVEIGWRLAFEHWGRGYATERPRAALAFAFRELGLEQVVSFTVPQNVRSWRVMERIGMTRSPADDFDHPRRLLDDPRLRRHVL